MAIVRGKVGSGITERDTITWTEKADRENPEVQAFLNDATLEGLLNTVENECFAVMAAAGLPATHGWYFHSSSGEWTNEPRDIFQGWFHTCNLWHIARSRGIEYDSEEGFAARMLGDVYWLREKRSEGDHDRVALYAYYLGFKRAELRLKREREKEWETGRKQHQVLGETRERFNLARQAIAIAEREKWQMEAEGVWSANPRLSKAAVAEIVRTRLKASETRNTIRQALKKPDKAG